MQRYVENPLLVQSKKFDIRLYIVIKGVDPIEAYLFEEGLARFCTVSKAIFSDVTCMRAFEIQQTPQALCMKKLLYLKRLSNLLNRRRDCRRWFVLFPTAKLQETRQHEPA